MEYHEEVGAKSSHSWSDMREWLEIVTHVEFHDVDRDTCSTCSTVVDVGESFSFTDTKRVDSILEGQLCPLCVLVLRT